MGDVRPVLRIGPWSKTVSHDAMLLFSLALLFVSFAGGFGFGWIVCITEQRDRDSR